MVVGDRADSTGRRNTPMTEVCDGSEQDDASGGVRGAEEAVVGGSGVAASDAFAGPARAVACGAAGVLAPDRIWGDDGSSSGGRGGVMAGRFEMVPSRWRDA